jgi:DNA invertase Pin-like site-specific DNA recombinase
MNTKVPSSNAGDEQPIIRCAIYARYSSEGQREASIEDQTRNYRVAAEKNGWVVLEEFIRSDAALTGRTLAGRDGLADLIRLAKQRPKPFDCILIDDTSRLGRYLPDVLRECDRLKHYDVFLHFASDHLDSRDPSFRILHLLKGYRDEDFIRDLASKIHRGQEGRILKGYVSGNTCYGYKNVPIPDENRKGSFGKPALIGVKQEIIPEQAEVVLRIFEMRASELSFGKIA